MCRCVLCRKNPRRARVLVCACVLVCVRSRLTINACARPRPQEPSPYITKKTNGFAALGAMMDEEEAAEEAARLKAEREANSMLAKVASIGNMIKEKTATPVARRTRTAFTAISQTMSDVIAAVSPMIAAGKAPATKAAAAPPAAAPEASGVRPKRAPAAKPPTAAKAPIVHEAPVRRSSRLRA